MMNYNKLIAGFDDTIDSDSNWLISLNDLLSLLLVFFIMFVVMTKGPGANEKARSADQGHEMPAAELEQKASVSGETVRDEIESGMSDLDLGDDVSVLATNREIIITIKEKVTFSPGEADILDSFKPVLNNIAVVIHKYPYFNAEIIGHTDNVPINTDRYPSNWELSVARAASVLKYLIKDHYIDSSRLSIQGNADQKPVAPNNTPANRARNRRVEIRLKHVEA